MVQVAALEIIQSEFHFTLTQSKYWLEAREGGLGELMKPWGKWIVFRKKNVMGIQPDGRVKFASFYFVSCSGRIFWKLEWRYRQKKKKKKKNEPYGAAYFDEKDCISPKLH